jgi:class 3 adenylate cyclase
MGKTGKVGAATRSDDLIGRLDERNALGRWLTETVAGAPRIVIVSGPPGMGKTRLLRTLTDQARAAGCLAAWGSALEGIDVPFLAAAPLLAGIPGGSEALAADRGPPSPWGMSASHQLVGAVDAVQQAAWRRPVLLVVDDLQWADEATLAFVQNLSVVMGTAAESLPVMLAVTLRAGEGTEPGRRAARRLAREQTARRLHVGPLNEVEVRELHHRIADRYPSRVELRSLMDVSGGSPLLVRARLSSRLDPTGRGASVLDVGVDLLGGRFAALPRSSRRAVEMLALLGDRVATEALGPLLGPAHEQLLHPALASALLSIDGDAVLFEHSLHRNAVLQSIDPERADALAADVAERVSSEPLRSLLPPAMVAAHLRLSPAAVPADIVAAIRWAAGSEAFSAGAWGQAAEYFESALLAAGSDGPEWTDLPQRWFLTGEAAFRDHDVRSADHLRTALDLADPNVDLDVIAKATILRTRALLTLGAGTITADDENDLAAIIEGTDPQLDRWRSALLGIAAECRFATNDLTAGAELARRARMAATLADDPLGTWAVEIGEGLQHVAGLRLADAAACFVRAVDTSKRAGSPWHEASSRHRSALVELLRGDLTRFDDEVGAGMAVSSSCHHWAECSFGGALRTVASAVRGASGVEVEAENAAAMYRRTSYVFSPGLLYPALAYARATRGDIDGARDALSDLESIGQSAGSHRRALARFDRFLGGSPEPSRRPRPRDRRPDLEMLAGLAAGADDAIGVGDTAAMAEAARRIDDVLACDVVMAPSWPHYFPRIRAQLAIALDEPDARDRLESVVESAAAVGLAFERVLLDLLASTVADEHRDAVECAARALRRADDTGLLAGVVLSQERLRRLGTDPLRPLARAVLNTDIVSSTDLTRTLGDERWLEVLDEHDELMKSTVRRHGGVVFKHTGDGMFAWFASAADAVAATEILLGAFEQGRLDDGRVAMRIRAGLALGSPRSRSDGDLFGMTVIEAARLCSAASPGVALVSAAVAERSLRSLALHGRLDLKGFDRPVEAYRIEPLH